MNQITQESGAQKLNVIINGFVGDAGAQLLRKAFHPFSLGYCMSMCRDKNEIPQIVASELTWHQPGFLETVEWQHLRPVDEALVEAMASCEAVFLHMMSRRERGGRPLSYSVRKRRYLQVLQYWNHILEENSIHLFLSYHIPHRDAAYVLYCLCRHKGIPILMFRHIYAVPDTLLLFEDLEEPAPELPQRLKGIHDETAKQSEKSASLSEHFEQYYVSQTTEKNPVPWSVQVNKKAPGDVKRWWKMVVDIVYRNPLNSLSRMCRYLRKLCSISYIMQMLRWGIALRRGSAFYRFYDRKAEHPNLDCRYIYIPLHLQPECSTCPMGGAFADQILMVQLLASSLPQDVLLYVKEHPLQQKKHPDATGRDQWFYKDLLSIPSVRLVPRDFSTFPLMERCAAVATVTGTAGFEALFREKPVLVFGHHFYQYAPGVFPIRSRTDCKQAMEEIFQKGVKPTLQEIRCFLSALGDVGITGYVDDFYEQVSSLSPEENAEKVGATLAKRLSEVF